MKNMNNITVTSPLLPNLDELNKLMQDIQSVNAHL